MKRTKSRKNNIVAGAASLSPSQVFSSAGPSPPRNLFSFFIFFAAFLFVIPSLHAAAAWQPAVVSAVLISVFVLAVIYMLVHVLHWDQFKGLVKDELGQAFITFLLVVVLITGLPDAEHRTAGVVCGISGMPDFCPTPAPASMLFCKTADFSTGAPACPLSGSLATCGGPGSQPLNCWALNLNSQGQAQLGKALSDTLLFNKALGYVSSVGGFCNMLGVGFSVAGCSTYGVLRGPVGQMFNAIGIGMMDLQAEQILLNLNTIGFTLGLLLPLGVLLRALHWTRKAGGTLIALSLSLYFIFPASLLLGQAMADQFINPNPSPGYPSGSPYKELSDPSSNLQGSNLHLPQLSTKYNPLDTSSIECNPYNPDTGKLLNTMDSFTTRSPAASPPNPSSVDPAALVQNPSPIDRILFIVLVRNLLMTVVALTITLSAVRVFGQAFGAEIDVWGIARLS